MKSPDTLTLMIVVCQCLMFGPVGCNSSNPLPEPDMTIDPDDVGPCD